MEKVYFLAKVEDFKKFGEKFGEFSGELTVS